MPFGRTPLPGVAHLLPRPYSPGMIASEGEGGGSHNSLSTFRPRNDTLWRVDKDPYHFLCRSFVDGLNSHSERQSSLQ